MCKWRERFRCGLLAALLCLGAAALLPAQTPSLQTWTLVRDVAMGSKTDTAAMLGQPQIATVGPAGETLVFDYSTRQIKVYNERGAFVRSIGRQGEGPGEFNRVLTMGFLRDTLWTNDSQMRRITLFPPSRDPITMSLLYATAPSGARGAPGANSLTGASPKAMLLNGLAVAQGSLTVLNRTASPPLLRSPIVLMRRDDSVVDTVATHEVLMRRQMSVRVGNGTFLYEQPFQAEQFWGARTDGRGFFVLHNTIARSAAAAAFTIHSFDSAGTQSAVRSYRYQPVMVTNRMSDSVISAVGEKMRIRGATAIQVDSVRSQLMPGASLPSVTDMLVGRDGSVWLRRERLVDGGLTWSVINPAGVMVATVKLPPTARAIYADMDRVLAIETDQDGEDWVVRYRVVRGAP